MSAAGYAAARRAMIFPCARCGWTTTAGGTRSCAGRQVLSDPRLNRGTAFSYAERRELGVTGLVPPAHVTLDQQVARVYAQYRRQPDNLARNALLTEIHDRNEVLFYRLLISHLTEMLPIVYTPTISQAIKSYSHEYRRPRGVYLSVDHPDLIEESLLATGLESHDLDLIVATDAGAILGIGDWGVGGMRIAVGKLAVYTTARAASTRTGRWPSCSTSEPTGKVCSMIRCTSASANRDIGAGGRQVPRRVRPGGQQAVPAGDVALGGHRPEQRQAAARPIRDRLLTFNDDVQGTGAVNLAAVLAAVRATSTSLAEHRVVIYGAGTAGTDRRSAARADARDGLTKDEARAGSGLWRAA